jgi:hypothetical protein
MDAGYTNAQTHLLIVPFLAANQQKLAGALDVPNSRYMDRRTSIFLSQRTIRHFLIHRPMRIGLPYHPNVQQKTLFLRSLIDR